MGGGLQAGGGINLAAGVTPPPVVPGQPVPAITVQQLQAMNDTEFVNYLNGLKSTPIDQLTYYNHDWDTQRLVANMPELNQAPQLVDAQTFNNLPGQAIFRTVNMNGRDSAVDICGRTMTSDVTTIGAGRMGDGFYFATSKGVSQRGYGNYSGDVNKAATMSVKLNSNAKIVAEDRLGTMLAGESSAVRNAVRGMRSNGQWIGSGYMAYALRKGYNVVSAPGIYNIIDRNAATWSMTIEPVP